MFVQATAEYYHPGKWTVSQLVMEMGNTKRVSEVLGVSQRQVERYLNFERGSGKQSRSTRNVQGRIETIGKQFEKPKSARGKEGVTIKIKGKIKVRSPKAKKDNERPRTIEWPITDAEWTELVNIAAQEGEITAQAYFFGDLYGVPDMNLVSGNVEPH